MRLLCSSSAAIAVLILGGACAPTYVLRAAHSADSVGQTATQGLRLSADPEAWNAAPYDLERYLTPLAVQIVNNSGKNVRVSYADFALINQAGFRFAALDPYTGSAARPPQEPPASQPSAPAPPPTPPAAPPAPPASQPSAPAPPPAQSLGEEAVFVASSEPFVPAPRVSSRQVDTRRLVARNGHHHGLHRAMPPSHHFYVYPHERLSPYHHYPRWPHAEIYPPYYGLYVYGWSDDYYPGGPSLDVRRLALPEGVIESGGQISGFLFFQNALPRSQQLRLVWQAHTPEGQQIADLTISFLVERH